MATLPSTNKAIFYKNKFPVLRIETVLCLFISTQIYTAPKEISVFQRKHKKNQLQNTVFSLIGLDNKEHDLDEMNIFFGLRHI